MPGGKGNINGKVEGKQFSSEYQPDKEIWTEDVALKFCNDMLDWLNEVDEDGTDKENIQYEEFIYMVADPKNYHPKAKMYVGLPSYLSDKFTSCFNLLEKAKKIQELKINKYGLADRLNASYAKFMQINHHGYVSDSSKLDHKSSDGSMSPNKLSPEAAKAIAKELDNEI